MAEAAHQFSLATGDTTDDRLADAPESVRARVKGLEDEAREVRGKRAARRAEIEMIDEKIHELSHRLHEAQKEEKKAGPYRKEVRELDPKTGEESVTVENLPYTENMVREIDALKATRNELSNKKSRPAHIDQVREDLGVAAPRPLIAADPMTWQPNEGEKIGDGYTREFFALSALLKDEDRIWNAPRTVAEVIASVEKEIDSTALPPGFGGHRRGHLIGYRGRQVSTPDKKIAWPRVRVGNETEVDDTTRTFAWLFRDQLKAAARERILATYTDEGTISEAGKPAILADIAKTIWQQRRRVEAAYLYARANGVTNLNRPKSTATEILLDVLPFSKTRLVAVADEAAPVNEAVIPAEEPDEADFEGDAEE
jgi:hypothetical protein